VVRLLALGANGILLGRAWVYALAANGRQGVSHFLDLIAQEIRIAMALTGCRAIADISPAILAAHPAVEELEGIRSHGVAAEKGACIA
jgi:L-lactate dehydrogenase (cytochrome)